jgi:hypothetical protein
MSEVADETEHVEMSTFACPPAGAAEYFMALVLAAGQRGRFDEVHDLAVYPRGQRFLLPRMRGNLGYRIEGERVRLWVEHIENPRDAANLSGTLALELWALPAPYAGQALAGTPLASTVIGSLPGQAESTGNSFDLPFSSPPAGEWHFVLILREWTAAGYVPRDFTNFNNPVRYSDVPANLPPRTEASAPAIASPVEPIPPARLLSLGSPLEGAAGSEPKSTPVPAETKVTADAVLSISVNTARAEELAAIKGISPQLARSILKKRPYASLDDLRRVKGFTAKLLASIRSRLTV